MSIYLGLTADGKKIVESSATINPAASSVVVTFSQLTNINYVVSITLRQTQGTTIVPIQNYVITQPNSVTVTLVATLGGNATEAVDVTVVGQ